MELIDKKKLRDSLVREQARYILSDRMTDKHISAGFMLAIVELDSQPVLDAIPIEWIKRWIQDNRANHQVIWMLNAYLHPEMDWRQENATD